MLGHNLGQSSTEKIEQKVADVKTTIVCENETNYPIILIIEYGYCKFKHFHNEKSSVSTCVLKITEEAV